MYLIDCLLLWSFVYLLPGLAFFPKLICSPRTAFALPILSVLIVYCLSTLLITTQTFGVTSVTFCVFLFALIALMRLQPVIEKCAFLWTKKEVGIYLFHLVILFPFFIKLGTHAFDRGDEIYSWNFWAIQHYFLEPIDFSHTGAPYPQLFPKLLAFCYQLLGSVDLQLPVKASLIVFPWAMLTAIAMAYRSLQLSFGKYWLLLGYVLLGVGLAQFFDDGYADPIMTSCLMVSVGMFWQSQQKKILRSEAFKALGFTSAYFLGISVLCAIACAHAKQPGLLWAMFSLPVLILLTYVKSHQKKMLWFIPLLFAAGIVWIMGEGSQFHQNKGVLWLSIGERSLISQFFYSVNKYFVHQPLLLILMALAVFSARNNKRLKQMVVVFLLPGLLLWFFCGAYQLRLGQHLIAFAFFVLVASGYSLPTLNWRHWHAQWLNYWVLKQRQVMMISVAMSLSIGGILFAKEIWYEKQGLSLYLGARQSLHRYFGQDADFIYTQVYAEPGNLLWVPSRYLYGLFYKHTQLTTPDYLHYDRYNQASLINELMRKLPDYVFTVSQDIVDGPGSQLLSKTIEQCPNAFEKVTTTPMKFNFMTYKVNKTVLKEDLCLLSLSQAPAVAINP